MIDPSNQPAANYLDQFASEGVHDSSGGFTISRKAAIEKLATSQLPRESAWVLKVVQSGVSLGATEIDVRQSSMRTTFTFTRPGPLDLNALQTAMLATDTADTPSLRHLSVALRAAGFGQRRPFRLSVKLDNPRQILTWDGENLREDYEEAPEDGTIVLEVEFNKQDRGRLFGASRATARACEEESAELVEHAAVCPIPLTFNGRRLDVLDSSRNPSTTGQITRLLARKAIRGTILGVFTDALTPETEQILNQALLCLAWSAPPDDGEPGLRLPEGIELDEPRFRLSNPMSNPLTRGRAFASLGNKKERASEFLCRLSYRFGVLWSEAVRAYEVTSVSARPSMIHWVIDGVVCTSQAFSHDGTVILDLYVSGAGLPTDISGMIPKLEGPVVEKRVARAKKFACDSVRCTQSLLTGHKHNYLKATGIIGSGAAVVTYLGGPFAWMMALIFGIIFSPAVGLAGVEAYRASKFSRRLTAECMTQLSALEQELTEAG